MRRRPPHLALLAAVAVVGSVPCPRAAADDQPAPDKGRQTRADCYGDPLPPGAVARLGTVRLRQALRDGSGAACVVFSPDDKVLVSGGDVGLRAWDVATGKELGWFRERAPATSACFLPDGKTLLTVDTRGVVRRWRDGASTILSRPDLGRVPALGMQGLLSADGRVAGLRDLHGTVRVWNATTGRLLYRTNRPGRSVLFSAALSPDGKTLAVSGVGNRAHLIDLVTGREVRTLEGPSRAVHKEPNYLRWQEEAVFGLTFSPDGALLAGLANRSVHVWEVAAGRRRYTVRGGLGLLRFSPDGKYLASASPETVRLFEAATGRPARHFELGARPVVDLAFSPDGKTLAAAEDYTVSLWDVATGKRLRPFPGHEAPPVSLAFSPDGASLASGDGAKGTLIVWDLKDHKPRYVRRGHYLGVLSIAFSPAGSLLATGDGLPNGGTGGCDAQIRLWDAARGELVRRFPGHINSVQSLAFSPDGRTLASAGRDARAKLWDVAGGKRLCQIRGADSQSRSVAFAPDGKTLLVAGSTGELALWDVGSGQKVRDVGEAGNGKRAVLYAAFLADGRTVLTREVVNGYPVAGRVCFYGGDTGRLLRSFPIPSENAWYGQRVLSPDGKLLATADAGPGVRLWDTTTAKPVGQLGGDSGASTALAFSPDGRTLASGCTDTTVLLWDVRYARLGHLWTELAAGPEEAARALRKRAATPAAAVPFLKESLQRTARLEARAGDLIAALDDERFAVRERAARELERLGADAVFAVRLALEGSPSPEARARLQKVLGRLETAGRGAQALGPGSVRLALAVLEEVGTPEARLALAELARGPARSAVTREAGAALRRLAHRRKVP